jgi:hypothetical protein
MKRAAAALAAALVVAACAFSSERALFRVRDAATPIADGARFYWRENGRIEEARQVVYRRTGRNYEVLPVEEEDRPIGVLFIAVPDTPEEDYVVQAALFEDEEVRAYAFMWRMGESYRVVAAPRVVEGDGQGEAALARYCAARINSECRFDRAADVVAFYREAIYPAFVTSGRTPPDYVDQTPAGPEAPAE